MHYTVDWFNMMNCLLVAWFLSAPQICKGYNRRCFDVLPDSKVRVCDSHVSQAFRSVMQCINLARPAEILQWISRDRDCRISTHLRKPTGKERALTLKRTPRSGCQAKMAIPQRDTRLPQGMRLTGTYTGSDCQRLCGHLKSCMAVSFELQTNICFLHKNTHDLAPLNEKGFVLYKKTSEGRRTPSKLQPVKYSSKSKREPKEYLRGKHYKDTNDPKGVVNEYPRVIPQKVFSHGTEQLKYRYERSIEVRQGKKFTYFTQEPAGPVFFSRSPEENPVVQPSFQ